MQLIKRRQPLCPLAAKVLAGIVAQLVAFVLLAGVCQAQTGLVVFDSNTGANNEIYIMPDDGSQPPSNISNNPASDLHPSLSPDGTQVAFSSDRSGTWEIYVMNIDGSSVSMVTSPSVAETDGSGFHDVNWHPNGLTLVLASRRSNLHVVDTINVDGSGWAPIVASGLDANLPFYSFDGSHIYMSRNIPFNGTTSEIWSSLSDGSNLMELTDHSVTGRDDHHSSEITIGSDSKIVFYRRGRSPRELQLFIMDPSGSNQTNISNDLSWEDSGPVGSPARPDEVVFLRGNGGPATVWHADIVGNTLQNATQLSTMEARNADWWGGAETPIEAAVRLLEDLYDLIRQGDVQHGAGGLVAKVLQIVRKLESGHTKAASNQVRAFQNQVVSLVDAGDLDPTIGAELLSASQRILDGLVPTSSPFKSPLSSKSARLTGSSIPATFALRSPYPNPFNPSTDIGFDVAETGHVLITVHNILGRHVATLADGVFGSGSHVTSFDASSMPSGAYVVRMSTTDRTFTRSVVLTR